MTATTHPVNPEQIMALLDGELSADRAQFISAHMGQCPECHEAAAAFRSTSHALSQWQVDPLDSLCPQRLLVAASSEIASDILSQVQRWLRRFQQLMSRPLPWALACAVFAFLIGAELPRASRESLFAKYKVSTTAPPPSSASSIADQDYAFAAGGGNSAGDISGFSKRGASSVDHAAPNDPTGSSNGRGAIPAPMIARSVALSLVVKDFDAGRASLDGILARHNGYAAGLNVATPPGAARRLQASLRIPAPQLTAALGELKALGRLEAEAQNGEEVTQQHTDLVARLRNSRETEQRLQDVLRTRTGKVKDVLEVEEEIARVRGEIEQMEAAQKTLEHRVDFSTIDLKLAEEYKAQLTSPAPSVGMQLRNASINGFRSASESVLGIVLFFAESGPTFLLWLAILLLPARMLWRRYRRGHALVSPLGV
jgi:anti-sigma factor RsiW